MDEESADSLLEPKQKVNKLWYVLAAALDVEANFLVLEAYNYTSITSVMLLDCFTIPCAMILSYTFLGCTYTWKHSLGIAICLSGLSCIILNDYFQYNQNGGSSADGANPVIGDILCLSGAVLYASSNVLQEKLVKYNDRFEFLGHLGCFGLVIAGVQMCFIDLPKMRIATYSMRTIFSILGFVGCLFLMYINTSAFLQASDAIVFNLSLLTSDVYAVIFSYFFYGYWVSWLYLASFLLVMTGLIIYHSEKPPNLTDASSGYDSPEYSGDEVYGIEEVKSDDRKESKGCVNDGDDFDVRVALPLGRNTSDSKASIKGIILHGFLLEEKIFSPISAFNETER